MKQEMDFQRQLLQIGQALATEEVKAMVFLCTDLSLKSLSSVELFSDLCSCLFDRGLLSPESPQLLAELLLIIQRPTLVRDLNLINQGPRGELISPYRKLLYDLSEEITDEDLKNIKFLLNQSLPRRKLNENVTTLQLFLEMEHVDLLSETKLDLLQHIMEAVCPMLNDKINHFKEEQAACVGSAVTEIGSLVSVSYPVDQNLHTVDQKPQPLDGGSTLSYQMNGSQSVAEPSFNSLNASMDSPLGLTSENAVMSQKFSDLSIGTKCFSVKEPCDALKISPGTKGISEKPTSTVPFRTTATNDKTLETYPMTGTKRGVCLIINNRNFTVKDLKTREGTEIDQECLERVFQWLGFKVEVHNDCTGEKMISVVQELSRRNHRHMDCVVCCFLSHGEEGAVYSVDRKRVRIRDLMKLFNGSQCPSLANKPKLFFIQACQGNLEQQAVVIQSDGPSEVCSDAVKLKESIPNDADFLMGMATVPSFVSYRDKINGTWFIQALCKNLVQLVPHEWDLVSILTKVNADVSEKTDLHGIKKQMPQPAFSLRKKVVFPVPTTPPPAIRLPR